MNNTLILANRFRSILSAALLITAVAASGAGAAIELIEAAYRPDRVLPEFYVFWKDWYNWGDSYIPYSASGALAIYVRNTGANSVTINDLLINGASMASGMGCTDNTYKCEMQACSVYYPRTNQTLVSAGEPIWWRADPNPIPAGGTGEIFVRMRTRVLTTLSLVVQSSAGNISTSITVTNNPAPRIAGIGLSPDYTKAYLYLRHPVKGKLPVQILVDGVDRTGTSIVGGDVNCDLVVVECGLGAALIRGTYHCFQAVYDDGSKATDGLRVYYDDFKYCRWGGPPASDLNDQLAHLIDMGIHSMNLQVNGWGPIGDITKTAEGHAVMDQYGIRKALDEPTADRLYAIFLCDEIDGGDSNVPTSIVPATIGALAQDMAWFSQSFKANYPQYPTMLNLAANYKPYNHYIYGQIPDILSVDPYYQARISDAYWKRPNMKATYSKATYIYAVASSCQAGLEPGRLHVILYSCRDNDPENNRVLRWAAPEEKRIEAYYALAAGAKEIDYWWFTRVPPTQPGNDGIGDADEPGSAALWREIGLIGAEAGIASPIIVNSCPAVMSFVKPGALWVRGLVSGVDTLLLICVNDDYAVDESGIAIRSIKNADVGFDLPDWIGNPAGVFEIGCRGVSDVPFDVANGRITVHLGRVDVTRMIVVTKNSSLKSSIAARYSTIYGPRVTTLIQSP